MSHQVKQFSIIIETRLPRVQKQGLFKIADVIASHPSLGR